MGTNKRVMGEYKIKKLWRWLIVMSIILIIYFISDLPNLHLLRTEQIPLWVQKFGAKYTINIGTTGFFSYTLSLYPEYVLRKIGHILAFGTLGVSFYWATAYSATWAIALTALAAAGDEWHQSFVTGRNSRFGDVVLDTLAAIAFILIVQMIKKNAGVNYHSKPRRRHSRDHHRYSIF